MKEGESHARASFLKRNFYRIACPLRLQLKLGHHYIIVTVANTLAP